MKSPVTLGGQSKNPVLLPSFLNAVHPFVTILALLTACIFRNLTKSRYAHCMS